MFVHFRSLLIATRNEKRQRISYARYAPFRNNEMEQMKLRPFCRPLISAARPMQDTSMHRWPEARTETILMCKTKLCTSVWRRFEQIPPDSGSWTILCMRGSPFVYGSSICTMYKFSTEDGVNIDYGGTKLGAFRPLPKPEC